MIRRWTVFDREGFEYVVEHDTKSVGSYYAANGFWGLPSTLPQDLGPLMLKHGSAEIGGFKFIEHVQERS